MLTAKKIKELFTTPVNGIIFNVPIDGENYALRVKVALNSCTTVNGERCVWTESKERCPRLYFCLNNRNKYGKRAEFVCYIKEEL
jgi:hypothetical protein